MIPCFVYEHDYEATMTQTNDDAEHNTVRYNAARLLTPKKSSAAGESVKIGYHRYEKRDIKHHDIDVFFIVFCPGKVLTVLSRFL